MSLKTKLETEIINAMKQQNNASLSVFRLMKNTIQQYEIKNRKALKSKEVSDKVIIELLEGMIKQHQETKELYDNKGEIERANIEQFAIDLISEFLPPPLPECPIETVSVYVSKAIEKHGTDVKKKGMLIKEIGLMITEAGFKLNNRDVVDELDKLLKA